MLVLEMEMQELKTEGIDSIGRGCGQGACRGGHGTW